MPDQKIAFLHGGDVVEADNGKLATGSNDPDFVRAQRLSSVDDGPEAEHAALELGGQNLWFGARYRDDLMVSDAQWEFPDFSHISSFSI